MTLTLQQANQVFDEADCLVTYAQVEQALERMADAISRDYAELNPLILCVMNGGLMLTGQLLTRLHFPLQIDYLHASRYRDATAGGQLQWSARPQQALQGRHLLLLDDILDEGHTLLQVIEHCVQQGAASVKTAVLVDKEHTRKAKPGLEADYTGLRAPDRFLFGCGMDYRGYWRNAPGIYAVKGL